MDEFKEYTVREVYEALKQDGFEHLRGEWTSTDMDGVINGGCVLGQTAVNLGVLDCVIRSTDETDPHSLMGQLNQLEVAQDSPWFVEYPMGMTITSWNDKEKYDEEGESTGYYLETYQEVTAMAYAVLEPHFDKIVTLKAKEWRVSL